MRLNGYPIDIKIAILGSCVYNIIINNIYSTLAHPGFCEERRFDSN